MYTIKSIKTAISSETLAEKWDIIASYMDDDIREDLHARLAPCSREKFLARYLNRDPQFAGLLKSEFSINL